MTNRTRTEHRASLLRWIFQRGDERMPCQVETARAGAISVISTSAERTLIEMFDDTLHAFQRHAQIAMKLRDYGWRVASYGR
jgi:hypothetical protein